MEEKMEKYWICSDCGTANIYPDTEECEVCGKHIDDAEIQALEKNIEKIAQDIEREKQIEEQRKKENSKKTVQKIEIPEKTDTVKPPKFTVTFDDMPKKEYPAKKTGGKSFPQKGVAVLAIIVILISASVVCFKPRKSEQVYYEPDDDAIITEEEEYEEPEITETQVTTTKKSVSTTEALPNHLYLTEGYNSAVYRSGSEYSYIFTPGSTGYYRFYSEYGSGWDPKIEIYEEPTCYEDDCLESDDDDGDDYNFDLSCRLNKGKDYYICISFISGDVPAELSVYISSYSEADSVGLYFKENGAYISKNATQYLFDPSFSSETCTYNESDLETVSDYQISGDTIWLMSYSNNSTYGSNTETWWPLDIDQASDGIDYYEESAENGTYLSNQTTTYDAEPSFDSSTGTYNDSGYHYAEYFTINEDRIWLGFNATRNGSEYIAWYPY